MKSSKLIRLSAIALTLIVGIGVGLWQVMPPSPPGENSPYHPAYQRMLANIEKFAVEPHPSGSAEIETVRGYIVAEIEDMGLTPIIEEHEFTAAEIAKLRSSPKMLGQEKLEGQDGDRPKEDSSVVTIDGALPPNLPLDENGILRLQNILVKLESPGADGSILFVSHYDSQRESPGASDDMLGVCSRLESIRSQANNTNLKTNLYFLFTDAEEIGLLGAYAFIKAHPEMKDEIDVVVNMDMGGRGGIVLIDMATRKAYPLVQMILKSGARPMASSLVVAIDLAGSDLTAFRSNGFNGIGMSATASKEYIHGPTDTYQNMDKATAWHFLHTTLALTDYAANNSLTHINDSPQEGVYFPFLPGCNIRMPVFAAYMLSALACVLALVWAILQIRSKQFKVSFSVIIMGLLILLTAGSAVSLVAGSYLVSVPLLAMTIAKFLEKRKVAYVAAGVLSGITALLLWTPVVYLVLEVIIKPMIV